MSDLREVVALIEWSSIDIESRVYTVLQEENVVCVCSDDFFVGRFLDVDDVRRFIRDFMRGTISEEVS